MVSLTLSSGFCLLVLLPGRGPIFIPPTPPPLPPVQQLRCMTALRHHSVYLPSVVSLGLPPKQPRLRTAAAKPAPAHQARAGPVVRFPRERIPFCRWRQRARQRLLQSHAGRVGRLVRVRQGWQEWRARRAWTLARWHKRISAELHRWAVLMKLVARVWRALQAVHCEGVQRITTALKHHAHQLCARCLLGWRGVVTQRARKQHALLHYAMALEARPTTCSNPPRRSPARRRPLRSS